MRVIHASKDLFDVMPSACSALTSGESTVVSMQGFQREVRVVTRDCAAVIFEEESRGVCNHALELAKIPAGVQLPDFTDEPLFDGMDFVVIPHFTPVVIAHRGASGYLPEHTLEAKAMAHAQCSDYLEQDVVLTRDNVPVVLHDIHLDTVTDVAALFPGRNRNDGRYYAIDFTLDEIRRLAVSERFHHQTGVAVFANRFPAHQGRFKIPTLEEELQFIHGLNRSTGRTAGIYPEIKQPGFHRQQGKDISRIVVETLHRYGYYERSAKCYVQCFDRQELRRVRRELNCQLPLIQLLEEADLSTVIEDAHTLDALMRDVSTYAQGIGPNLLSVFSHSHVESPLVQAAHAQELLVHPWTCRVDALPRSFESFVQLHAALRLVKIDGIFSDFPDQSLRLLRSGE